MVRRDVGQIPQSQTSDSSDAALSMKAWDEDEEAGWRARSIVAYCGEGSGSTAQTADIMVLRYNAWVSRHASFFSPQTGLGSVGKLYFTVADC